MPTYLESYQRLETVEDIKTKAIKDTERAMFLIALGVSDNRRLEAIEEAMNQAIKERKEE